jgi:hypothetical protein
LEVDQVQNITQLREAVGFEMAHLLARAGSGTTRWMQWVSSIKSVRLTAEEFVEMMLFRAGFSSAGLLVDGLERSGIPVSHLEHVCLKGRRVTLSAGAATRSSRVTIASVTSWPSIAAKPSVECSRRSA